MRLKVPTFFILTLILVFVLADLSSGYTSIGDNDWKTYNNRQLGFSIRFPADLDVKEFPDGLMLLTNKPPTVGRNVFNVTNNAFSWLNSIELAAKQFNLFRKARLGSTVEKVGGVPGTFRKVEDLVVDGHPAVKMIYDNPPSDSPHRPGLVEMEPAPSYDAIIYIKKEKTIWAITSFASDRNTQEGRAKTFEQIVSTFKFS